MISFIEFLPVEFFSSESEVEKEIIQCNMVSVEEYEVDTEVDEITLRSGRSIPSTDKNQQNEEADSSKAKKKANEKRLRYPSRKRLLQGKFHRPPKKRRTLSLIPVKQRSHLKSVPTSLSVYDALQMSRELSKAVVMALISPDLYKSCFKSADVHTTEILKFCASCLAAITFGEDDFLLGFKFSN
ncbi:hypothetical protein L3X38_032228 [Prunus dulcis]|uniref:Uncharacterized protein n=1 Tax=Prunus dulcis TaxID=3755 RepID=A0AAD4VER0_PRUDU|nr:hypothetical protein L3X38_032228 [Prunus dulcis]